jgi:hypothetical protein
MPVCHYGDLVLSVLAKCLALWLRQQQSSCKEFISVLCHKGYTLLCLLPHVRSLVA